ncbi:unnamed protein product [Clonostachys rhizophaga]|uniref:Uncharacterized protein n=1 Tax=Clonostachys rhizophaga TaxID=160324 RepID=A0A9N9YFG2_9HYPO|nr:unnamed protein product [Clonostachys rhizophaga]
MVAGLQALSFPMTPGYWHPLPKTTPYAFGESQRLKTTALSGSRTRLMKISPDMKKVTTLNEAGLCMWSADAVAALGHIGAKPAPSWCFPSSAFILVRDRQEFRKINKSGLLHTDTGDCVSRPNNRRNREGAFSDDSALIAFADGDSSASYISVYTTTTGNRVQRFECLKGNQDNLSFSKDSKLIAAIGNGMLCTWDVTSGQCRQQTMPESYVNASYLSITFSPDLDWAVGINLYNNTRVWRCATGRLIHDCYVPSLGLGAFDTDYIIVSSSTSLIYFWDFQTGIRLARTKNLYPHHGAVSFQPKSSQLLVGTGAVERSTILLSLVAPATGSALTIAGSPGRQFLLSTSELPADEFDAVLVSGSVVIIGYKRLGMSVVFGFSSARGSKPMADIHFIDHCNPIQSRR